MCTIRERTNSFSELYNWIRKLSYSIKELTNTAKMPTIRKMMEFESFPVQLQSAANE